MTTETSIPTSEGEKTATGRDGNVKWYSEDISQRLQPSARELLEKYSKIPPDEVESHVYTIVSIMGFPLCLAVSEFHLIGSSANWLLVDKDWNGVESKDSIGVT